MFSLYYLNTFPTQTLEQFEILTYRVPEYGVLFWIFTFFLPKQIFTNFSFSFFFCFYFCNFYCLYHSFTFSTLVGILYVFFKKQLKTWYSLIICFKFFLFYYITVADAKMCTFNIFRKKLLNVTPADAWCFYFILKLNILYYFFLSILEILLIFIKTPTVHSLLLLLQTTHRITL